MRPDNWLRIVPGKNGKGYAYVRGNSYPVEGPGDGTRFATEKEARDHATRDKENPDAVHRGEE